MDNIAEDNFFQITLSQQAANWLIRLSKITVWLFILGSITCLLNLVSLGIRYFLFFEYTDDGSWIGTFQLFIVPVFEMLFFIITFIQIYFFYKFSRMCRKGIELQHSDLFNRSFHSLLRNTLLAAVMFILQLVFICLIIYWQLLVLNKQP